MPDAADLPELQGPVAHDPIWVWLAAALTAVALALLLVPWLLRRRRARRSVPSVRHVEQDLDAVAADVEAGRLSAREGHQRLSAIVRTFAARRTGLPVEAMTLQDLRSLEDLPGLAELVGELYPPEFAGREDLAAAAFTRSVAHAREVVRTWT